MRKFATIIAAAGLVTALPAAGFAIEVGVGVGADVGAGVSVGTGVAAAAGVTGAAATSADIEAIADPAQVKIEQMAEVGAAVDETTTASVEADSALKAALQSNAAVAAKLSEAGFSIDDVKGVTANAEGGITLHVQVMAE